MTDEHATAGDVQADQQQILECIARAQERAGGDDRAFVRYLNECYATAQAGAASRGLRVRAAASSEASRVSQSQQLLSDPRYLANARELARRTQGGTRVIGGVPTPPKEFLDCVAVGNDQDWGCTGTLLAPGVVVTAGHCAEYATRVFFGSNVTKPGRIVAVRDAHRHPRYQKADNRNDLLVLVLAERITNIAPRTVAPRIIVDKATDGRVVGFGNTDPWGSAGYGIKRQVDVPIASPSCEGALDGRPDAAAYGCHAGAEFVAGKPLLAKDSCTGDSGGPFYVESNGAWLLAGATSRATNKSPHDCGDGGIYVRVEHYLEWIRQLPGVTV